VSPRSGWFAARPRGTEDVCEIHSEGLRGAGRLERIPKEAQAVVGHAIATA